MLTIGLEQARFHAFHGLYPEEGITGNEFIVDVYVTIPGTQQVDSLDETVNYQGLFSIVKTVMEVPRPLLEEVVYDISAAIKQQYPGVQKSVVTLRKMSPPMGADIRNSVVSLEKNY